MKLKQLLDASDLDFINGYEVEEFAYLEDCEGILRVTIADGEDTEYEVDQQQHVTLSPDGYATAITTDGTTISLRCYAKTLLTPSYFE